MVTMLECRSRVVQTMKMMLWFVGGNALGGVVSALVNASLYPL